MIDNALNRLNVKRGSQLPWAKLDERMVMDILAIIEEREALKKRLRGMTNAAIAERYGVHIRTIDKISACETWTHVLSRNEQLEIRA